MTVSGMDVGHNTCIFNSMTIFPDHQWDSYSKIVRFPIAFQPRQAYVCVAENRKK